MFNVEQGYPFTVVSGFISASVEETAQRSSAQQQRPGLGAGTRWFKITVIKHGKLEGGGE